MKQFIVALARLPKDPGMATESEDWRRMFEESLRRAYPTPSNLAAFVRGRLHRNLHEIAHGNLTELVFQLVEWADSRDMLDTLLIQAVLDTRDDSVLADLSRARLGWPPPGDIERGPLYAIPPWVRGPARRRLVALGDALGLALEASREPSGTAVRTLRRALRRLAAARFSRSARETLAEIHEDIDDYAVRGAKIPRAVADDIDTLMRLEMQVAKARSIRRGAWILVAAGVLIAFFVPARNALIASTVSGLVSAIGWALERSRTRKFVGGTLSGALGMASLALYVLTLPHYTSGHEVITTIAPKGDIAVVAREQPGSKLSAWVEYDPSTGVLSLAVTNHDAKPVFIRKIRTTFTRNAPLGVPQIAVQLLDTLAVRRLRASGALDRSTPFGGVEIATGLGTGWPGGIGRTDPSSLTEEIGIQIINWGATETKDLVVWPFRSTARQKLGIHSNPRIELRSIAPGMSTVVVIPICPCVPSSDDEPHPLTADELDTLVQHSDDTAVDFYRLPFVGRELQVVPGVRDMLSQRPVSDWGGLLKVQRFPFLNWVSWRTLAYFSGGMAASEPHPRLDLPLSASECAVDFTVPGGEQSNVDIALIDERAVHVAGTLSLVDADDRIAVIYDLSLDASMHWRKPAIPGRPAEPIVCKWAPPR